jgi:dihydroxy-acid dehydratase
MRGAGPIGYPGGAEVVNMQPPAYLIKRRHPRAALHRRRPPVGHVRLAVDPQRLARGGGRRRAGAAPDRRPGAHRPPAGTADILVPDEELARRRAALAENGGYPYPPTRRPGRKSSAAWSTSSTRAWC